MVTPYITKLDKVECRGWTQVDDVWLSTEPLYDKETDLYARLSYKGALEWCAKNGAALPARSDILRLHDNAVAGLALELVPVELPDAVLLKAAGIPSNPKADAKAKEQEINDFRSKTMGGRDWADYHDDRVWDQLLKLKWDKKKRLANCGKHWMAGAPKGYAYLMGWWEKPKKAFVQGGLYTPGKKPFHDDGHHDYGTLTIVVSKTAP